MTENHSTESEEKSRSNFRLKKWVVRSFIILIITFAVLAGSCVLILTTQQQRFVNLALKKLNEQIKGELTIRESKLSLFKHFPYISIALHEARLYPDKTQKEKPITSIDRLYIAFSLPDILQHNYEVRRLSIHGGEINLVSNEDSTLNLLNALRFSSDTQDADTTTLNLSLDKVKLDDFKIEFFDQVAKRKVNAHVEGLTASFSIHHNQLTTDLESEMILDVTTPSDTLFFRDKNFQLTLKAAYKTDTKQLTLSSANMKLQDASFIVKGTADLSENERVDLTVEGDKPDINLIAAFLPGDIKQTLKPFQYDGRVYFNALVKGTISPQQLPLIEVSFGCEDVWFLNTSANRKVDSLGFKGFYTNGSEHSLSTSELHITNVSARPEKGVFKGNFVVRDFINPKTLVQIKSELELKFLGEFFGIPDLKQISGKIKLDMNFKELKDIQLPEQSLNKLKEGIESNLSVENLSFRIPGYPHPVRNMNLHAEMRGGKITLDSALLSIGESDIHLSGSLSDIKAFLRERDKTITVALNMSSNKISFKELFSYDTALSHQMTEEIHGFSIKTVFETSVNELLHPSPLPKGKFDVKDLNASLKEYHHEFKNLGATIMINDTTVRLRHLTGIIDQSDFQFSGRVNNYQLWFDEVRKGKTQIAFDFKSNRFAFQEVLGRTVRKYLPYGYRREEINNAWLRAKVDLKYDTVFRFAKAEIVNVTGDLVQHNFKLKDIKGKVRYGARVLIVDTLKGNIGKSDFDINLRLFAGKDLKMRKRTNSLKFHSVFMDGDELSSYGVAVTRAPVGTDSARTRRHIKKDTSVHAAAFNMFTIPFSDFDMQVDIGKLKYNKLWLKEITARARMQADQHIFIDTLAMIVAEGTLALNGELNGSDTSNIYFTSTIKANQLDLEKVMIKLDHLGQDVVINKNIKGRLSGQIKSYVQIHPDFVPIISKAKAELNIKIYNGSLVDFAPMQAISTYFKDKNLRVVRFDTLENKFSLANGVLSIPSMDINSSLGYIQMSGKQSLDLNMEYYVRVPIKMVTKVGFVALFDRKPEEVDLNQVDEVEHVDKDKKISFMNLKVTGTPEDFKVALGKKKIRN